MASSVRTMLRRSFSDRGELAPGLAKQPGLFGLYFDRSDADGMLFGDISASSGPCGRDCLLCESPSHLSASTGSARSSFSCLSLPESSSLYTFYDSGSDSDPEDMADRDWVFAGSASQSSSSIRRSNAVKRESRQQSITSISSDLSNAGLPDFGPLDLLLNKIADLINDSAAHLQPRDTAPASTPRTLPHALSTRLMELHPYLAITSANIVPDKDAAAARWSSPLRIFPSVSPTNTLLAETGLSQHPSSTNQDAMAARWRVMQRVGASRNTFDHRHLLPTLFALLTAEAVVKHLLALLQERTQGFETKVRARADSVELLQREQPVSRWSPFDAPEPLSALPSFPLAQAISSSTARPSPFSFSQLRRRRRGRTSSNSTTNPRITTASQDPPAVIPGTSVAETSAAAPAANPSRQGMAAYTSSQRKGSAASVPRDEPTDDATLASLRSRSRRLRRMGLRVDRMARRVGEWIWKARLADENIAACRNLLVVEGFLPG